MHRPTIKPAEVNCESHQNNDHYCRSGTHLKVFPVKKYFSFNLSLIGQDQQAKCCFKRHLCQTQGRKLRQVVWFTLWHDAAVWQWCCLLTSRSIRPAAFLLEYKTWIKVIHWHRINRLILLLEHINIRKQVHKINEQKSKITKNATYFIRKPTWPNQHLKHIHSQRYSHSLSL